MIIFCLQVVLKIHMFGYGKYLLQKKQKMRTQVLLLKDSFSSVTEKVTV